jgi:hypothetical protein
VSDLPPVIQAWIAQLTDERFVSMIRDWPADQIDVRLSSSRGRVRRLPEITFAGGPQEMVSAGQVIAGDVTRITH